MTLDTCYSESKNYSDTIMSDVVSLLAKKGINHNFKSNGSEIIITDNQTSSSIINLLNDNLTIPKDIISLLLDVVEVSNTVYIRQKTK